MYKILTQCIATFRNRIVEHVLHLSRIRFEFAMNPNKQFKDH